MFLVNLIFLKNYVYLFLFGLEFIYHNLYIILCILKEVKVRISSVKGFVNTIKPSFKGYTVDDYKGEVHKRAAFNTGRPIEKTLGSFHLNETGKIYYADPLEKVSDGIREKVDYVVYDHEPKIPDVNTEISRLYFEPSEFGKESEYLGQLRDAKDYFYRLEMADSKTVGEYEKKVWSNIDKDASREKADYFKAHVNDARYNQETLAISTDIFNESADLRREKDALNNDINDIKENLKKRNEDVPKAKTELYYRTQLDRSINDKIKDLEQKESLYKKLKKIIETSVVHDIAGKSLSEQALEYNDKNHDYKQHRDVEILSKPYTIDIYKQSVSDFTADRDFELKQQEEVANKLKRVQKRLQHYKQQSVINEAALRKVEAYTKELPTIISNLQKELVKKTEAFEKAKADLIPLFDKLKNYFYSRGIRSIK